MLVAHGLTPDEIEATYNLACTSKIEEYIYDTISQTNVVPNYTKYHYYRHYIDNIDKMNYHIPV